MKQKATKIETLHLSVQNYVSYLLATKRPSANTLRAIRSDLEQFLSWDGPRDLRARVANYFQVMRDGGLSQATQERRAWSLRRFLFWSEGKGLVAKGLAQSVPVFHDGPEPEHARAITQTEWTAMVNAFAVVKPNHAAILAILGATGCEASEIAAIRKDDVQEALVTLHRDGRNKIMIAPPFLATYQIAYKVARASRSDPPFLTHHGNPFRLRTIWRACDLACARAKIDPVSPRDLRRSHVVWSLARGDDPQAIADRLGVQVQQITKIQSPIARIFKSA